MKVALVWHGQMRDFHKCIIKWQTFIAIHKPDIFAHTWAPAEDIFFTPTAFLIEKPNDFDYLKSGVTNYGSSALNVLPQTYSIYKADSLRNSHELIHGINYDWVVRSRFDLSLHNPGSIQFDQMSPNKIHVCSNHWGHVSGMYDDNLMVMSYKYAHISRLFFNETIDYISEKQLIPSGEQLVSHCLNKPNYIEGKGIGTVYETYKNPDLDFTLARML